MLPTALVWTRFLTKSGTWLARRAPGTQIKSLLQSQWLDLSLIALDACGLCSAASVEQAQNVPQPLLTPEGFLARRSRFFSRSRTSVSSWVFRFVALFFVLLVAMVVPSFGNSSAHPNNPCHGGTQRLRNHRIPSRPHLQSADSPLSVLVRNSSSSRRTRRATITTSATWRAR